MKRLFIAALCGCCASAAVAEVTVSVANGTSQTFTSVTAFVTEGGHKTGEPLGSLAGALKPGESATVTLGLTQCQPVLVQAVWGEDGIATVTADACDSAFYTITE